MDHPCGEAIYHPRCATSSPAVALGLLGVEALFELPHGAHDDGVVGAYSLPGGVIPQVLLEGLVKGGVAAVIHWTAARGQGQHERGHVVIIFRQCMGIEHVHAEEGATIHRRVKELLVDALGVRDDQVSGEGKRVAVRLPPAVISDAPIGAPHAQVSERLDGAVQECVDVEPVP
eukprot:scaffold151026_cov35-Tisochrysis_lutea.AAC.2